MEIITSKENSIFRDLVRLSKKKYRDLEGRFIAEGPNAVSEALLSDSIKVETVIAREGSAYEEFSREGAAYEEFSKETKVLSRELFDRVSDTVTSQGILAIIDKPDRGTPEEILSNALSEGNILVLDRLQDPGNIGTIIRTSEGAGIKAVVFIKGTCDPFSPKVVRACAGSVMRMPMVFLDSVEALKEAAGESLRIATTDVRKGVPYYESGLSGSQKGIALVIGNEGNGVSQEFIDAADVLVTIPMDGKLESLNAGIAAALLMYELRRP